MLSQPINRVQCIGLAAWLASQALNPYTVKPFSLFELFTALAILGVWLIMTFTRRFIVWRLCGGIYMLLAAYLFKLEILRMGEDSGTWAIAVATLITLCATIFFINVRDYIIASIGTWLVMWNANAELLHPPGLWLYCVFVASSLLLGSMVSMSFVSTMRRTYELRENYRKLAETDVLTGAPNRRALMEKLNSSIHLQPEKELYFAMLDIDDFKRINDRHGHDAGDTVLIRFAHLLDRAQGKLFFGRLGGEEFGLILASDNADHAMHAMQCLLETVHDDSASNLPFSFSAGLVSMREAQNVTDLLKRADEGLYNAKNSGKGRVVLV